MKDHTNTNNDQFCDFEVHPVGTSKRISDLENQLKDMRRKQKKGIRIMRPARDAADDVSTPIDI